MEWKGIDLTGKNRSKWIFTAYNTIKQIAFALLLAIGIGLITFFYYLQKIQEIHPLVMQLNQLKTEISVLENKINYLKSDHQTMLPFAENKKLEKFIILIEQLPLKNGGIDSLQIYLENHLTLKLSGKIHLLSDFQKLEKYLNEKDFIELKTDQININNRNETEFIFTLKYKG